MGQAFALAGFAGLVAGLLIGRMRTERRERWLIAGSTALQALVLALLAITNSIPVLFGLALIAGVAGAAGNVAIFALRQRRTDPAWFGRAFAVSFSLNVAGQQIGSALSGPLLASSITQAFVLGAAVSAVATTSVFLIPRFDDRSGAQAGTSGGSTV